LLVDAQKSCYVHQHYEYHRQRYTADTGAAQDAANRQPSAAHRQIKLALDVHAVSPAMIR
jgi:hypothetical protein